MLSSVTPKYKFTDGPAFIIGKQSGVQSGKQIPLYIPSLMPDIEKNTSKITSKVEKTVSNTIFANPEHPTMKGTVTTTNYIYANARSNFVLQKANEKLIEDNNPYYITRLPNKTDLKAGGDVNVRSDTGSFRDLYIV